MAKKQISQLTQGSITNNNDVFAIDTYEGTTVKIPYSVLAAAILNTSLKAGTNISITETTTQGGIKEYTVAAGAIGTEWYFGSTQPESPKENDYWLRTDTGHYGDIYQYDGSSWTQVGTFAGRDGQDGQDGITPSIDSVTKHWMIGATDTGVVAEGQDGATGATGAAGADGASISATVVPITGGHTVTISSTDPDTPDVSFDVMDGSAGGYTGTNGITVTGSVISANIGDGLQVNSSTGNIEVVGKQASITMSSALTLAVASWNSSTKQQTVTFTHDTSKRNVIDVDPSSIETWTECGVYAISETSSGITFKCAEVPSVALTFRVTSMEVV